VAMAEKAADMMLGHAPLPAEYPSGHYGDAAS